MIKIHAGLRALWGDWIHADYLAPHEMDGLERSADGTPGAAICLPNFWRLDKIAQLPGCLERLHWQDMKVQKTSQGVSEVAAPVFVGAASTARFSSHDVAKNVGKLLDTDDAGRDEAGHVLASFLSFSLSAPMASWMTVLTRSPLLAQHSAEIARYKTGDFISAHTDCVGNRAYHAVSYLDPAWTPDDGGQLVIEDGKGNITTLGARFNSLVILAIAPQNSHSVSIWRRPSIGRQTLSISFGPRVAM